MTAQRAALQITGKAGTYGMEREADPIQLAKLARKLYQSGVWKLAPRQGPPWEKYQYLLRSRLPEALVLPEVALRALVQSRAGCGWCALTVQAALHGLLTDVGQEPGRQELEPDAVLLELLGQPCARCSARHADRAARKEAARQAEAGAGARAALRLIEREDGRLAAKVAELGLRLRVPPDRLADLVASAAGRPVAVPGISAPAVRPVRPAAARQRPAAGLRVRVPDPAYIRRGRRP